MAGQSWLTEPAYYLKKIFSNKKLFKVESGLKIVHNRRQKRMDLKRTNSGGTAKVLDDFRISNIGKSIKAIIAEYNHTIITDAPFNSAYEGWAFIKAKVDGLWEEIKKAETESSREVMLKEAAQIGAMAMRFIIDLEDKPAGVSQIDGKKSNYKHFS